MANLKLTEFEAIAAYDAKQNPAYGAVLLIEPLYASVVLYAYTQGNLPTLLFQRILDNPTPVNNAIRDLGDWTAYAAPIKKAIQNYYKFGTNAEVSIAGLNLSASNLMLRYSSAVGNELENAFREADSALAEAGISEDKLHILLVGPMATFFPAEATARLHYSSAMPMLFDARYGTYPQVEEIVLAGAALCAQMREKFIDGSVEWLVTEAGSNYTLRTLPLILAKDSANVKDFATPVFAPTSGVLATAGETVNLTVCGSHRQIPVTPQFLEDRMGLINLGLQYENDQFIIIMQNTVSGKNQLFPMDIKIKGV